MTTSADIRSIVVGGLNGETDAGTSVFSPFDWPTSPDSYPCLLVTAPKERKRSLGKNAPLFEVTTTVVIEGRVAYPADVQDAGSALALAAAERLQRQIEVALINNTDLWVDSFGAQIIEQFESIESEITTSSGGEVSMANLVMRLEVQFIQDANDFAPIFAVPLTEIVGTVQQPQGVVEPMFSIPFPQNPIS